MLTNINSLDIVSFMKKESFTITNQQIKKSFKSFLDFHLQLADDTLKGEMKLVERIVIKKSASPEDWKAFWLVFCYVTLPENCIILHYMHLDNNILRIKLVYLMKH